jgi:acetyltransferase-like isoleucine patch superfamily enzyme
MLFFKHDLSDVKSTEIGAGTRIWQYAIVLEGARIGDNCNINCHTFIENDVVIGNNVTIKSGVYLWDGMRVDDDVFIGPNVTFVNDKYPRSKQYLQKFIGVQVLKGATIGAGSIVLCGIRIGRFAMVGAGSVVTKDIPDFALVYGNPAVIKGYVNEYGEPLRQISETEFSDSGGRRFNLTNDVLIKTDQP